MKKTSTTILAVASIALMATAAGAQSVTPPKAIAVKVGANFPMKSSAKDAGNTWFGAGLDYSPKQTSPGLGSQQELLYLDYTGASKNGTSAHYLGVGVGTHSAAAATAGSSAFYDAGIGAYFQSAKVN